MSAPMFEIDQPSRISLTAITGPRHHHGRYVRVDNGGRVLVDANWDAIGPLETFTHRLPATRLDGSRA